MLEQYWALKREAGDALLLYRLGDFYEMFFEDATYAAPLLGLVLTARHKDSDVEAPMCGIPQHALESYLARLVASGRKVAISEQTEAPAKGRALVSRKIVRIVTPGTIVDPERLDARRPNEMAAVTWQGDGAAVSTLDLSTGDFVVVVNAEKIVVTGNKLDQKRYYRHSGYPGGLKSRTLREQLDRRPTEVIRTAVKGMLPRNRLARQQLTKLKVYAGPEHPHGPQNPQPLNLEQ